MDALTALGASGATTIAVGIDASPTHIGIVALDLDATLLRYACVTKTQKEAELTKVEAALGHVTALPSSFARMADPEQRALQRLLWLHGWLLQTLHEVFLPLGDLVVGLEDYAYRSPQGAHQIGEIGGIVRLSIVAFGAKLRLHDVMSIKMAVTGKGNADKDVVQKALVERHGALFPERLREPAIGDLYDAYAIADLVRQEILVRQGKLYLEDLDEKVRRVFLRTTKHQPVNLLAREYGAVNGKEA